MMSLLKVIVSLDKITYSAETTCVKSASTENAGTKSTGSKGTYIKIALTGSICTKGVCTRVAFDKDVYVESICAIEYSGMHS